jgi:hypothetical protein
VFGPVDNQQARARKIRKTNQGQPTLLTSTETRQAMQEEATKKKAEVARKKAAAAERAAKSQDRAKEHAAKKAESAAAKIDNQSASGLDSMEGLSWHSVSV